MGLQQLTKAFVDLQRVWSLFAVSFASLLLPSSPSLALLSKVVLSFQESTPLCIYCWDVLVGLSSFQETIVASRFKRVLLNSAWTLS
ncbi:hypothetical protein DFH08DRAFT_158413 [Mycena albidolilacea]|uniref:Uncharacterized protein n=1 Tax=Mycena albidolilacea TaxID=1033008 RepID=A0AAD7A0M4_9AGAR|nr:hypothetical protein DFH08DRAFT_158413 [Mycena albidolilacea]